MVDGKDIEDVDAIYAHWASDNAASSAWCPSAEIAGEICGTAASAAIVALEATRGPLAEPTARVMSAIVAALTPRAPLEDEDPRELAFLRAIEQRPSDDETRLVYADWLEEHGHEDEAALLRLELAGVPDDDVRKDEYARRLRSLSSLVHPAWLRSVSRR